MTLREKSKLLYTIITYASNQEGIDITIGQTIKLINNLDDMVENKQFSDIEKNTILNLYYVYKDILNNNLPYNENNPVITLCEINRKIGQDIIYQNGKVRSGEVLIKGSSYIPPKVDINNVNMVLQNNLYKINQKNVLTNCVRIMKLQPFNDGNKRSAIALTNLLLFNKYKSLLIIPPQERTRFHNNLVKYYENEKEESKFISYLEKFVKEYDFGNE